MVAVDVKALTHGLFQLLQFKLHSRHVHIPRHTSREVQLRFSGLDVLATSVVVVQLDGCVLHANAALEDLLGVSRKTSSGQQYRKLL